MDKTYASRAGGKLQHALNNWGIGVKNKICADLGCSTGGFTDCLLQNGARKVYAIDTAYGVLDWKLRNDERVIVMERTNALYAKLAEGVDFISVDVGWTPQKFIIPKALIMLNEGGDIVSLLKPHYEADKSWLAKGKVRDEFLEKIISKVKAELKNAGVRIIEAIESPIAGSKGGNKEYLIWIKK